MLARRCSSRPGRPRSTTLLARLHPLPVPGRTLNDVMGRDVVRWVARSQDRDGLRGAPGPSGSRSSPGPPRGARRARARLRGRAEFITNDRRTLNSVLEELGRRLASGPELDRGREAVVGEGAVIVRASLSWTQRWGDLTFGTDVVPDPSRLAGPPCSAGWRQPQPAPCNAMLRLPRQTAGPRALLDFRVRPASPASSTILEPTELDAVVISHSHPTTGATCRSRATPCATCSATTRRPLSSPPSALAILDGVFHDGLGDTFAPIGHHRRGRSPSGGAAQHLVHGAPARDDGDPRRHEAISTRVMERPPAPAHLGHRPGVVGPSAAAASTWASARRLAGRRRLRRRRPQ